MPRLDPQQLLAARRRKRETVANSLLQGILGSEREFREAIEDIDNVMFAAVEFALWHWFYEILPRHFGNKATATYGYPDRSRNYMVGKFIGKASGANGRSRWRFPRKTAYSMAGWTGPESEGTRGPDPKPLELSGTFRTRVTAGPVGKNRGVRVRRIRGGYVGVMTLDTPAFIRRSDLNALVRYNDADLAEMLGAFRSVVAMAFGYHTVSRGTSYAG